VEPEAERGHLVMIMEHGKKDPQAKWKKGEGVQE
jgi:hypothetical protein